MKILLFFAFFSFVLLADRFKLVYDNEKCEGQFFWMEMYRGQHRCNETACHNEYGVFVEYKCEKPVTPTEKFAFVKKYRFPGCKDEDFFADAWGTLNQCTDMTAWGLGHTGLVCENGDAHFYNYTSSDCSEKDVLLQAYPKDKCVVDFNNDPDLLVQCGKV